jgi:type VI secretion system protein ImpB
MALNEQHKRVSKNRVSITYDVETGGAVETIELPFIIGVLGDFSADKEERAPLEERTFVDLNKDNFDQVMERVAPRLQMKVENTLEGDDSVIEADLTFSSMKDFEPEALIEKVEPLAKLMETRTQLKDLLAKADRSRDLEALLKEVLQDADTVAALSKELGVSAEPKSD